MALPRHPRKQQELRWNSQITKTAATRHAGAPQCSGYAALYCEEAAVKCRKNAVCESQSVAFFVDHAHYVAGTEVGLSAVCWLPAAARKETVHALTDLFDGSQGSFMRCDFVHQIRSQWLQT